MLTWTANPVSYEQAFETIKAGGQPPAWGKDVLE